MVLLFNGHLSTKLKVKEQKDIEIHVSGQMTNYS